MRLAGTSGDHALFQLAHRKLAGCLQPLALIVRARDTRHFAYARVCKLTVRQCSAQDR
jgi:hypothetical protein